MMIRADTVLPLRAACDDELDFSSIHIVVIDLISFMLCLDMLKRKILVFLFGKSSPFIFLLNINSTLAVGEWCVIEEGSNFPS